jgi:hypothetical protein
MNLLLLYDRDQEHVQDVIYCLDTGPTQLAFSMMFLIAKTHIVHSILQSLLVYKTYQAK